MIDTVELYYYLPTCVHDYLLIQWWATCIQEDCLQDILDREQHTPRAFLDYFATRPEFLYAQDDKGMWLAGWTNKFMDEATFSLWIRKDKRRTKEALTYTLNIFLKLYDKYKVLVCATQNDEKESLYKHIGFTAIGSIPFVWGGLSVHCLYMTKHDFDQKYIHVKEDY